MALSTTLRSPATSQSELNPRTEQDVLRIIQSDGVRAVRQAVETSVANRSSNNNPALFILAHALSFGDDATRQAAAVAVHQVVRTGADILHLAAHVDRMRGWGRSLRNAFAAWYNDMPVDRLAYQVLKYQRHNGWTHRDILRVAHPRASTPQHQTLYHLITQSHAAPQAQITKPVNNIVLMIEEHDLPCEVVSIEYLTKEVWSALLAKFAVQ